MNNSLGIALLVIVTLAFMLGYLIYVSFGPNKRPIDLKGRESKIVWDSLQNYWYFIMDPLVQLFIKLKITPNSITILGFVVNVVAALFISQAWWGLGGWILVLGAAFDILDGRVARTTGQVSRPGRYLDSVVDRFSEGALMIGFVYAFREHWMLLWVLLCFISSYLVSFTRAKAEADGVKSCEVGIFQRSERIFVLCVGLVFSPIISYYAGFEGQLFLYAVMILLTVGNVYTALYRIFYSIKELGQGER
jgi:archaetidylinositol phosphate synthase